MLLSYVSCSYAWMPLCICEPSSCLYSAFFVSDHISNSPVPVPAEISHPDPEGRRQEQESIEANGKPGASRLQLNGNVKLTMDPFCLPVEGHISPESTSRIIPVTIQCFRSLSLVSVQSSANTECERIDEQTGLSQVKD